MLGFGNCSEPVFMKRCATSCAGMSVHMERMIAMSSMHSASFGKTSLTSTPDLPLFLKLEGRAEGQAFMAGDRLVVVLREHRLRIPRIDVRRRALGKNVDDVLGLDREVGALGSERTADHRGAVRIRIERIDAEKGGEAECTKPHPGANQELTARVDHVIEARRMFADVFLGGEVAGVLGA